MTPQLTLNLGPALRARHQRQEHLGLRRHQPDRAAVPRGRPHARLRTTSGRAIGFAWTNAAGSFQVHGGYGHLLRPRHARDHLARARPRRPRAADRGARRQRLLPRSRDGRVPPFAPTFANPFTGFILPGRGRLGHQHHRQPLENPTVQQWNLGTRCSCRATPCCSVDLVHNRGTHFIIGRHDRRGVQPGRGRAGPRREPGVERRHALRRACSRRLEKRWGSGQQLRLSYTPGASPQLRERRPDPVRRRSDRPERPRARVRPHAQRAAPPAGARRASSCCRGELQLSPHLDDRVRRADGHPDAGRVEPRADAVAQRRRRASSRPAAELNAYLTALNAAGGIDGVPLPLVGDDARFSDSLQLARPAAVAARSRCPARASDRGDRRVLQRLQRHEHARRVQDATTRASRTCWRATAPTRPIPASCARPRSGAR